MIFNMKSVKVQNGCNPVDVTDYDTVKMDDTTGVILCAKAFGTEGKVRTRAIREWCECTYVTKDGAPE
jgi:hypothetical protein